MAKQFIIFLSVINLIYAQQKQVTQSNPCDVAAIDAKNDVEKWLWIEAGFRAFRVSKRLSKKLAQNPQFEKLQNKSDDWIIEYTNCYKEEVQNLRNLYSWTGCIAGNMILLIILSTWPYEKENYNK
tara:strand:- start:737 stop:1114 length:378 start_codon:yes stop_codon:yes gene_type:complete